MVKRGVKHVALHPIQGNGINPFSRKQCVEEASAKRTPRKREVRGQGGPMGNKIEARREHVNKDGGGSPLQLKKKSKNVWRRISQTNLSAKRPP